MFAPVERAAEHFNTALGTASSFPRKSGFCMAGRYSAMGKLMADPYAIFIARVT